MSEVFYTDQTNDESPEAAMLPSHAPDCGYWAEFCDMPKRPCDCGLVPQKGLDDGCVDILVDGKPERTVMPATPKCLVCYDTGRLPGGSGPSCDGICRDCDAAESSPQRGTN